MELAEDIVSFVRRRGDETLVVAVKLYPWRQQVWREQRLPLPDGLSWAQLHPIVGVFDSGAPVFGNLPVMVAAN
jgi:hypothetical protein